MSDIANDGSLVRGSIDITIASVLYTLMDFSRDGGQSRSEMDYDADGKPAAASHVEDIEKLTGTIRTRSDKVKPPKFIVFSYDSKNWYIKERTESGSSEGLKQYAIEIWESITGTVTVT